MDLCIDIFQIHCRDPFYIKLKIGIKNREKSRRFVVILNITMEPVGWAELYEDISYLLLYLQQILILRYTLLF